MVQRVATVAFEGIEARAVDVQVQVAPGLPAFCAGPCCPCLREKIAENRISSKNNPRT
jgi:hypothetical protein